MLTSDSVCRQLYSKLSGKMCHSQLFPMLPNNVKTRPKIVAILKHHEDPQRFEIIFLTNGFGTEKTKTLYRHVTGIYFSLILVPNTILSLILKAGFHFNRIVTYRSIFFCVETISSTLVLGNTIRFGTIRLKWKPALTPSHET